MKLKALLRLLAVLMMPVILACSCSGEELFTGESACTQQEIDWFWQDLEDNGNLDYAHECQGPKLPTPTPGLSIPVSDSKQSPCSMQWLSSTAVPSTGPYGLNVSPQAGAVSYEFVIMYPDGTQVTIESSSSDATLMMNDLPAGAYSVEVRSADLWDNEICSIQAGFTKPAPGFALNAAPACAMQFVSPANGAEFPYEGPVNFEWTLQPAAHVYVLDFVLPNGNHGMTDPTTNLSKTVYMEAFQPGGTYMVFVKALNAENNMICQISISFTKAEYPQQLAKLPQKDNGDDVSSTPTSNPFLVIVPIIFTPTPDVIR